MLEIKKFRKILIPAILFIFLLINVVLPTTFQEYNNFLTRSIADKVYCMLKGCTITGDMTVQQNLSVDGDIILQGDILTITDLEMNGSFLPTVDNKFDIGSSSKQWKDGYFSNNLYVAGNVGIGVTDPGDPLQVRTDSGGEAIAIEENSGDEQWELGVNAAGDLVFQDSGSAKVTFQDGGNVGFGIANPINRVHLYESNGALDALMDFENGDLRWNVGVRGAGGLDDQFIIRDATNGVDAMVIQKSTGNVGINNTNPKGILHTNGTVIHESGNVGIGTTSPEKPLHIYGDANSAHSIKIENANAGTGASAGIGVKNDVASFGLDVFSSGYTGVAGYANKGVLRSDSGLAGFILTTGGAGDTLSFGIADNTKMTIDGDGEVGIGVTDPGEPLQVLTDSGGEAIAIEENSGDEQWELGVDADGDLNFQDSGSSVVTFEDGGNVGIGTTAPGAKFVVTKDTNPVNQNTLASTAIFSSDDPGTLAMVGYVGADNTVAGPKFNGFKARGTASSPSAANVDDWGLSFDGYFWGTTGGTGWKQGGGVAVYKDTGTETQYRVPAYIKFYTTSSGASAVTEKMRITSEGNVGIGNTNPNATLHVTGNVNITQNISMLSPDGQAFNCGPNNAGNWECSN